MSNGVSLKSIFNLKLKKKRMLLSMKILIIVVIILGFLIVSLLFYERPAGVSGEVITSNPFFETDDYSNWSDDGVHAMYDTRFAFRDRYGVFIIHPASEYEVGFVSQDVYLLPGYRYLLKAGVANVAGWVKELESVCKCKDSIIRIKVLDQSTGQEKTYFDGIVDSRNNWKDLSYDISEFAGKTITFRAEGVAGGPCGNWCGEYSALDYFFVEQLQ